MKPESKERAAAVRNQRRPEDCTISRPHFRRNPAIRLQLVVSVSAVHSKSERPESFRFPAPFLQPKTVVQNDHRSENWISRGFPLVCTILPNGLLTGFARYCSISVTVGLAKFV